MTKVYSDKDFMMLAVEEHLKCPEHPRVGAVISKAGLLLSTGFRGEVNGIHAERVAIEKLEKDQLRESTLYTTLEPCVTISSTQPIQACTDLILTSGITEVVVGVLDPNGTVYSQGYRRLLEGKLNVRFFSRKLRQAVEEETFEFTDLHEAYGPGKRRIPVVHGGTSLKMFFSATDTRSIQVRWNTLQFGHGTVDLISSNGSVRLASGATAFHDITDPSVFRFAAHFARMSQGKIAIVKPSGAKFCVLFKLLSLHENDIVVQWEVRNDHWED
jgi:diaminohydroxyphosphoribosylaminopyrimidine deaminase/5-amino-6-(5-phosphoribosylamino)uracil reductase